MKNNIWDSDNNRLFIILSITFISVYFFPGVIYTRLFFLSFIPVIYFAKKDYLWLVWLFILFDAPGYLFSGGYIDDPNRIPSYPIVTDISISFYEIITFTLLIKSFRKKRINYQFIFKKESLLFIGLFLFYFIYTFFFFKIEIVKAYRTLLPWTYVYIFYVLIDSEYKFLKFNKVLFPIVFIVLLMSLYSILQGEHFVNLFKKGEQFLVKENLEYQITPAASKASRILFSVFIIFYCTIISLFYYYKKESYFPKNYLLLIISIAYLSCIITGTRGYFLALTFIIFISLIYNSSKGNLFIKIFRSFLIIAAVSIILINIFPVIKIQLDLAIERLSTIIEFAKGDISIHRIEYRIPEMMEHIRRSPILGYGFSSTYFNNTQNDIGFHTTILNVGYLGIIFLYSIFIALIIKIWKYSKSYHYQRIYSKSGYIFIIGLLGILIFHFSTNISYGLDPGIHGSHHERYFIYALLLNQFNLTVRTTKYIQMGKF